MKDTVLLHLGHPLFRRSLATFANKRYPGTKQVEISRWCVRRGGVPAGLSALVLLTVEELAANELRQPFHHWISTIRIPVKETSVGSPLPHLAAAEEPPTSAAQSGDDDTVRDIWLEIEKDVANVLRQHAKACETVISERLKSSLAQAMSDEKERFGSRKNEIRKQLSERSIARLKKELENWQVQARQLHFDEDRNAEIRNKLHNLEEELERRTKHDNDMLQYLEREEKRVLETVLPQQFRLRGDNSEVQVFPVAIEIRLPETKR
jgi:hypothetical protein